MSGIFNTEHDVMQSTANRVDNVNANVQGELDRLQGTVEAVAGSWKGSAQGAFDQLMIEWNESATKLQTALQSISENIRANARAFQSTEEETARTFTAMSGLQL